MPGILVSPLPKETDFSSSFTDSGGAGESSSELENNQCFKNISEPNELTACLLLCPFQTKVGGPNPGGGSFEEVLSSTAHASAQSSAGAPRREEEELQC